MLKMIRRKDDRMNIKIIGPIDFEEDENLEKTKLFGSPVFPKRFIRKRHLENYYFLMQINIGKLKDKLNLPDDGFLYVFIDITTNKPKILYTAEVISECVDDIDEPFNEGEFKALYIEDGNLDSYILKHEDEMVTIISLRPQDLPNGYLPRYRVYDNLKIKIPYIDLGQCNFSYATLELNHKI